MLRKNRILVVEDNSKVVVFLQDQLENFGFEVLIARNGKVGLDKARNSNPDLVLLDIMMPELDGYEVCRQLKSSQNTRGIPILMLTAKGQLQDKLKGFDLGADDYLPKPYDQAELQARITALLQRSVGRAFAAPTSYCNLLVSCKPEQRIDVRLSGLISLNITSKRALEVVSDTYSRYAENVQYHDWRFNSKQIGIQLFKAIFSDHSEVLGAYQQTLGASNQQEEVHLRFESNRDFLRVPLEFIYDHLYENGDYLILRHPLTRSISGISTKKKSLDQEYFNNLYSSKEPLKILFIASDTPKNIPEVDTEIDLLNNSISSLFDEVGITVQCKTIFTEQATYEHVKQELNKCKYDILHYAGHGSHEPLSPEHSFLSFWEKPNRQGHIKHMSVAELQMLLRGSSLKFVYLSCCLGGAVSDSNQLIEHDFLGIADGLLHAGIPAVLSYRWPVLDNSAKELAQAFYTALARYGKIDTALLEARCEIAAQNRDDITWLSPILIEQT